MENSEHGMDAFAVNSLAVLHKSNYVKFNVIMQFTRLL